MRNLINVVLFVLVLFGSIVPASAQDPQEGGRGTADVFLMVALVFAIVVPILGVLVPFLIHIKNSNKAAHDGIVEHMKDSEKRITNSVKADIDRVYNLINTLIPMIGRNRKADE